jgi:hypothetical protein
VRRQYVAVLRHVNLKPYVGHEAEWALVCSFTPATYKGANHSPDKIHADLQVCAGCTH